MDAKHSGKGIDRQLDATFNPPANPNGAFASNAGDNTGSTYTPPPPKCPVKITLNSRQGPIHVRNGSCPAIAVGGNCTYDQDNKRYAQCDCVEVRRKKSEWQCYPNP